MTALVYASVFAAFLPAVRTPGFDLAPLARIFMIETGWCAIVASARSTAAPRKAYLRGKAWIDPIVGSVMVTLGITLGWSARGA
jgi:threonine/homoserine/homoserine lactone efflux protein